jgi:hypothetical protein
MTTFRSLLDRLRGKTSAPPPKAEVTAPQPEPVADTHLRHDAEYRDLVTAAGAAFTEMVVRNGCYFPGDTSMTLEEVREQLRQARGQSRFS